MIKGISYLKINMFENVRTHGFNSIITVTFARSIHTETVAAESVDRD